MKQIFIPSQRCLTKHLSLPLFITPITIMNPFLDHNKKPRLPSPMQPFALILHLYISSNYHRRYNFTSIGHTMFTTAVIMIKISFPTSNRASACWKLIHCNLGFIDRIESETRHTSATIFHRCDHLAISRLC